MCARPSQRRTTLAFLQPAGTAGIDQGVVVGVPGAGLGELGVQLGEQAGDLAVDVLGAVVRMEAHDREGEEVEEALEHGQQEALRDRRHGADELVLGDFVHRVDQVDALAAVEVALVDGVHAQEAGAALGTGSAALADGHLHGLRGVRRGALAAVGGRGAQVVEVADRDPGQAREAPVAEHLVLAAHHLAGGRPGHLAEGGVDVREQTDVGRGVAALEGPRRWSAAAVDDAPGVHVLAHEARQLRPRQTGRLAEEALERALVGLAEPGVAEARQRALDEGVGLLARPGVEVDRPVAVQEGADLFQGAESFDVEAQDHPPMIPDAPRQAHFSLESTLPFRLTSHWTRLVIVHRAQLGHNGPSTVVWLAAMGAGPDCRVGTDVSALVAVAVG